MAWFGLGSGSGPGEAAETAALETSKASLVKDLHNAIKEFQVQYLNDQHSVVITTNDSSDKLLNVLEAVFVHGLKDSFLGIPGKGLFSFSKSGVVDGVATSSSARKQSDKNKPQPNFWTYVLVFSHKDTLQRIDGLRQVQSDVGRSRAWVRLALNECVLSSYFNAMSRDRVISKRHYKRGAILRDNDCLDEISRLLSGIEVFKFDLALNSGLLNKWQPTPLILAGLLPPVLTGAEAVPVVGLDATSTVDMEGIDPLATKEPEFDIEALQNDLGGHIRYIKEGILNEEEALKMILRNARSRSGSSSSSKNNSRPSSFKSKSRADRKKSLTKAHTESPLAAVDKTNSSSEKSDRKDSSASGGSEKTAEEGQAAAEESQAAAEEGQAVVEEVPPKEEPKRRRNSDDESDEDEEEEQDSIYSANFTSKSLELRKPIFSTDLLFNEEDEVDVRTKPCDAVSTSSGEDNFTKVNTTSSDAFRSRTSSASAASLGKPIPCLSGFIDSWDPFGNDRYFDTPPANETEKTKFGFNFQNDINVPGLNVADSQRFLHLFDVLARDHGLDIQNYECAECTRAIGTIFGPAKLCGYTKKYYCDECHLDDTSVIPARVVYNWDFNQYKVCRKVKTFMKSMAYEPIIEATSLSNDTIEFSSELKECLKLRKELMFMNAYLTTCLSRKKPNAKKQFNKLLHPRTYLVEEDAKFAISDFEDMHSGKLKSLMTEAAKLARNHILKDCVLCSNRGFICELCRQGAPLYPFNLGSIMQCQKCFVVFHLECSKDITSCPKCDRLEARNLNWVVGMSKAQKEDLDANEELQVSAIAVEP